MDFKKDPESGVWLVGFDTPQGKRWRSTKMKNRADAERVAKNAKIPELEMAAKANSLTAESLSAIIAGRKVKCADIIPEWAEWRRNTGHSENTIRTGEYTLRDFFRFNNAETWLINRITEKHVDAFVNQKDGSSRSNHDLRLSTIRSLFEFCAARAYTMGNPAKLVRVKLNALSHNQKERKARVPITEAEFHKLMAETTGFHQHAIALSYWTGLRLSDICCLEWDSISASEITVWTIKADARVAIPLNEPLIGGGSLAMTILAMMDGGDKRYVFPEERADMLDPKKRAKQSVYFTRIFRRCGIDVKTFHCLRHSFITRLKKAGKTLEEIGRIVGHRNTETTKGYVH